MEHDDLEGRPPDPDTPGPGDQGSPGLPGSSGLQGKVFAPLFIFAQVQKCYQMAYQEVQPNGLAGQAIQSLGNLVLQLVGIAEQLKEERDGLRRVVRRGLNRSQYN